MSFLIGGLSSQQYKAYLNPVPVSEEAARRPPGHWVAHFNITRYPAIIVLVNRLAYFFMQRLSVYPNNTYLFQKFKSHDFSKTDTQAQYEILKEIFARFQHCSDLKQTELEKVEDELNEVENRLNPKEESLIDEDREEEKLEETDKEAKDIDEDKKSVETDEAEKTRETQEAGKAKKTKEIEEAEKAKETEKAKQTKEVKETEKEKETEKANKAEAKLKKESDEQAKTERLRLAVQKRAERKVEAENKAKEKVEAKDKAEAAKTIKEVEDERKASDDEIFDPENDIPESPVDHGKKGETQLKDELVIIDEKPEIEVKDSSEDGEKDTSTTHDDEGSSLHDGDLSDPSDDDKAFLSLTSDESSSEEELSSGKNSPDIDEEGKGNVNECLQSLFDFLSKSDVVEPLDEEEEIELTLPLSKEVEEIVSQPFPLKDPQSINDLFQGDVSDPRTYRKNLKVLLHFEKQLRIEKLKAADPRFEDYMQELDEAFQRAWAAAYQQSAVLHVEFTKVFPPRRAAVEIMDNGDVVCTAEQFQWVTKKIHDRFPAIFKLAFDAPSLDIYQSRQMASLARAMMIGVDSHEKAAEIESNCFIRIRETLGKETPPLISDSDVNPLAYQESFIYTYFVGPTGKLTKKVSKLKSRFEGLAQAYVKEWLQRPGLTLQFGKESILGGQSNEDIKAGDWVVHVSDTYVQTLKDMSQDELKAEIKKAYQCPLIRLMIETYAQDIANEAWIVSKFPAALMKEMFKPELVKAQDTPDLHSDIRHTIEDANFVHEKDIEDLAKKAGVSADFIEPLIRIRIFYMMCCMGKNAVQPVVHSMNQRAKTMYDPSADDVLTCSSSKERTLLFDESFDEMTIAVRTKLKDPEKVHPVAEGQSVLKVSSISQSSRENDVTTSLTDLRDLRFSLYSSTEQMRYLVAQVAPNTLIANTKKLAQEIAQLEIVDKFTKYEAAKKAHANQQSYWSMSYWQGTDKFDVQAHRNLQQDAKKLDAAILKAKEWVAYLNTAHILIHNNQIDQEDLKYSQKIIVDHFKKIFAMLSEVYPARDLDKDRWTIIHQKSRELRDILCDTQKKIGVYESDSETDSAKISSSSDEDVLKLDDEDALKLGSDSEDESENVIGRKAGTAQKTVGGVAWDYTLGYLLNETSEVKYLRWKIERYEDLIRGVQKEIINYIETQSFGGVGGLMSLSKKAGAPEWMRKLFPILKFCQKDLRDDQKRLNPEYLEEVRKSYTGDMLTQLREAADWAKAHPSTSGVEHVNAICYHLYASLDINRRCQEIFNTFLRLGAAALNDKHPPLPSAPRYAIIDGLHRAHELIKAVPNDAKAPLLKQWANSLRGHVNGFAGVTSFDPNMQSNPIHVFFNKIINIKGKEEYLVKDIAMGSPTIETGVGQPEIVPEFQGFLRHCKSIGHKHLYINNQNYIPKAWVSGDESTRCQALHDLAENDFKDTLFVITLSQNSPFYEQAGHQLSSLNVQSTKYEVISQLLDGKCAAMRHYLPPSLVKQTALHQWMNQEFDRLQQNEFGNATSFDDKQARDRCVQRFHEELRKYVEVYSKASPLPEGEALGYSIYDLSGDRFKNELVVQMFDRKAHESGNCIPTDLVEKHELRDWSVDAIDQIHQLVFGKRKNLTVEERRIFIRLFYQNLSRKILIETEANSYNSSCKDRIDRGAATDAEDFAYLAILANCMNEQHVINFFNMLIFARAIIVRKRTIIEERLDRLIETVKFMIDHQRQLQTLQAQLFPNVQISIDQFDLKNEEVEAEISL